MGASADDADRDTMLSRSGSTGAGGKLTRRLDVPVSEDMEDLVISRAVAAEKPRAEFTRELLQKALTEPLLIGLPEAVLSQLDVLATISGSTPNALALDLLRRAVRSDFDMLQSMARARLGLQCDVHRSNQG